ncbi:DUF308 domain-containing protein [Amnibacterium sp. CER49]|uniref:DUF308 domain-containing protein n=1 Tax=Amnibacterium sp. CER49 TaxID=3039161 RepID=UPI00244CE587|nr:DUF308 domain-containing protein [Amnibacterium sp. CER49]MDH2443047.1 DUF308 domain-containing protein [Amnibacterium sp. CER49]
MSTEDPWAHPGGESAERRPAPARPAGRPADETGSAAFPPSTTPLTDGPAGEAAFPPPGGATALPPPGGPQGFPPPGAALPPGGGAAFPPPGGALPPGAFPGGPEQRARNALGVTALILGIVGLVLGFVPFVSFLAVLIALAAIVFGIVGLTAKDRPRIAAIWGLVLGAVGLLVAIIVSAISVFLIALGASRGSSYSSSLPSAGASAAPAPTFSSSFGANATGPSLTAGRHTVRYSLSGGGSGANVDYDAYANHRFGSSREQDVALPHSRTQTVAIADAGSYANFTITGSTSDATTPLTCSIAVDGRTVVTKTVQPSSYATVYCSYSAE